MLMTTLALLIAALAPAAATALPDGEDIVVVARRFDTTKGKLTRGILSKTFRCTVTRSSGDTAVDDAVCSVALTCVGQHKKRPDFLQCVAAGRQTFLDSYRPAERDDHAQN